MENLKPQLVESGIIGGGQTMENMKRQLVEFGIIGGVVDDFDPLLELTLCYKNKQIRFGEGATHVEIVHMPTRIQHETYENFTDRNLAVLVMTDPDAPGGEYLQWLIAYFFVRDGEEEILEDDIIYYEPPRGDARKIVVTIFNTSIESLPSILALKSEKKREGFSTKGFAAHHKLGLPVAVTFFNIETSEANRVSAPKPKRNKSTN